VFKNLCKGKCKTAIHIAAEGVADNQYPLFLTTGSLIYHWHGGEITSREKGLPEFKVCAVKVELA
jgi:predicted molibdopterin-dependent oxidoreductase YjgC